MEFLKNKKIWVVAFIAVLITAAVLTWNEKYPSGSWRYKMTVSVDTPEGIKTGSAVREVSVYTAPGFLGVSAGGQASVRGEAVMVDLGKRGVLFALMRNDYGPDYGYRVVFDAFPFSGGGLTLEGVRHYRALTTGEVTLTLDNYPVMITFRDINDPKTVEPVLETESYTASGPGGMERKHRIKTDNFEKLFGANVRLKNITIEMTDEPVTWKIARIIKSFGGGAGPYDRSVFISGDKP